MQVMVIGPNRDSMRIAAAAAAVESTVMVVTDGNDTATTDSQDVMVIHNITSSCGWCEPQEKPSCGDDIRGRIPKDRFVRTRCRVPGIRMAARRRRGYQSERWM